ncbi:MAG: hypothetical protein GQ569_01170 [Methylococcaceae bacterium]|nr:hypothetical protein [Methylococcaceae bacterium]
MKSIFNNSMFGFLNPHKQKLLERLSLLKDSNQALSDELDSLEIAETDDYYRLVEAELNFKSLLKQVEACYASKKFPLTLTAQQELEEIKRVYIEDTHDLFEIIDKYQNSEQTLPVILIALNLCRALQVLSIIFLISLESSVILINDLWDLCYRIYQRAETLDLLSFQANLDNKGFSIAVLFKQLIVFHSLDIQKLTAQNKKTVFFSLIRIVSFIEIKNATDLKYGDVVLTFDLNKDLPPFRVEYSKLELCEHIHYIKISDVINLVQRLLQSASGNNQLFLDNYDLFFPLFNALEQQKKPQRNFTRIESDHDCRLLLGLDNVIAFLDDHEKNLEASKPDSLLSKASENIEKKEPLPYSFIEKNHIINSTLNGYAIYWEASVSPKPKEGDIMAIFPHFHRTLRGEIGFVRRVTPSDENMIVGVELICLGSTLIRIEKEDELNTEKQVVLLYGSPNYSLSILCDKLLNYKSGDYISVILKNKKHKCQLGETINSNELIKQMKLIIE